MANFLPTEKVSAILDGFRSGQSVRQIAAMLSISNVTVLRYKPMAKVPEFCECGDMYGHKGWCSVRYAKSPSRQAFMATLIPKAAPCYSMRPGTFFLGFLSQASMHSGQVPIQRHCESKACPFPAVWFDENSHLCRYHAKFFSYSISMTDSRLGWEDLHDSEDEDATLSVVAPWDNTLVWEHRGQRQYESNHGAK